MIRIATLLFDRVALARVRRAADSRTTLRVCASGSELQRVVAEESVALVIVEPWDEAGESAAHVVETLRSRHPSTPVMVWCTREPAAIRELLTLARAGIHGVILRDADEPIVLRHIIEQAGENSAAAHVFRALGSRVPDTLRPLVWHCLTHAGSNLTVDSLAGGLRMHRRALIRRLARERWPGPRALLTWSRLLVAVRTLEEEGRSVEQTAMRLDFPSGTALRNALRRHVGLRPGEIRARGGVNCVLSAFERALDRRGTSPVPLHAR